MDLLPSDTHPSSDTGGSVTFGVSEAECRGRGGDLQGRPCVLFKSWSLNQPFMSEFLTYFLF